MQATLQNPQLPKIQGIFLATSMPGRHARLASIAYRPILACIMLSSIGSLCAHRSLSMRLTKCWIFVLLLAAVPISAQDWKGSASFALDDKTMSERVRVAIAEYTKLALRLDANAVGVLLSSSLAILDSQASAGFCIGPGTISGPLRALDNPTGTGMRMESDFERNGYAPLVDLDSALSSRTLVSALGKDDIQCFAIAHSVFPAFFASNLGGTQSSDNLGESATIGVGLGSVLHAQEDSSNTFLPRWGVVLASTALSGKEAGTAWKDEGSVRYPARIAHVLAILAAQDNVWKYRASGMLSWGSLQKPGAAFRLEATSGWDFTASRLYVETSASAAADSYCGLEGNPAAQLAATKLGLRWVRAGYFSLSGAAEMDIGRAINKNANAHVHSNASITFPLAATSTMSLAGATRNWGEVEASTELSASAFFATNVLAWQSKVQLRGWTVIEAQKPELGAAISTELYGTLSDMPPGIECDFRYTQFAESSPVLCTREASIELFVYLAFDGRLGLKAAFADSVKRTGEQALADPYRNLQYSLSYTVTF